ncbi:hypothetical protein LCGC14_1722670 [marine sediment metagenome]|uniref:Uncharacterized protein n=1 Tax=marine sediment metagenome TaxID=412755 RepID=A0A0F9KBP2_9ZZZZ
MAIDVLKGLRRAADIKRFVPTPQDLFRPFPKPQHAELVTAGIAADLLSFGLGFIPWVGDFAADFVNDNIMADVATRLDPAEKAELREQNRVYPNGIALVRTFQRTGLQAGGRR